MKKTYILWMIFLVTLVITGCGKKKENVSSNDATHESEKREYITMAIGVNDRWDKEDMSPYILNTGDKEYELNYEASHGNHVNNDYDTYTYIEKPGMNGKDIGEIEVWKDCSSEKITGISFYNIQFPYWEQKMVFDNIDEAMTDAKKLLVDILIRKSMF